MDIIISLFLYLVETAKYWLGNKLFFQGKIERIWSFIVGFLIILSQWIVGNLEGQGINMIPIICATVVGGVTLDGKIRTKTARFLWLFMIITTLDTMMEILYESRIEDEPYVSMLSLTTTIVLLLMIGYVYRFFENRQSGKSLFIVIYGILFVTSFAVCMVIHIIYLIYRKLPNSFRLIELDGITVAALLFLALLPIILLHLQRVQKLLEETIEREKKGRKIQETYYRSLLEKEEETRRYRHDMYNHFLAIRGLAKEEKAEKTINYVEALETQWKTADRKVYDTGNMMLNLLLQEYLAERKDTKISILGYCKREMKMDEVDFCTIFSNLIQNASEELERLNLDKKYFIMEIRQGMDYTMIEIRNSSNKRIEQGQEKLRTEKKDKKNHGIGMKNVKRIIKRYGGEIVWKSDGKEFKVTVSMKI